MHGEDKAAPLGCKAPASLVTEALSRYPFPMISAFGSRTRGLCLTLALAPRREAQLPSCISFMESRSGLPVLGGTGQSMERRGSLQGGGHRDHAGLFTAKTEGREEVVVWRSGKPRRGFLHKVRIVQDESFPESYRCDQDAASWLGAPDQPERGSRADVPWISASACLPS